MPRAEMPLRERARRLEGLAKRCVSLVTASEKVKKKMFPKNAVGTKSPGPPWHSRCSVEVLESLGSSPAGLSSN